MNKLLASERDTIRGVQFKICDKHNSSAGTY